MTSSKPYLIRALYDWMVDNSMTPHLLVDASSEKGNVLCSVAEDGRVILNISPSAIISLSIGDRAIEFRARFSGVERYVSVAIPSVLAIYSQENGSGMTFDLGEGGTNLVSSQKDDMTNKSRPSLRIIK